MNSNNKTVCLELNSSMMTNNFLQLFKRSELAEGCAVQLMTIHSQVLLTCHLPPLKTHHQCKAIFQLGMKKKTPQKASTIVYLSHKYCNHNLSSTVINAYAYCWQSECKNLDGRDPASMPYTGIQLPITTGGAIYIRTCAGTMLGWAAEAGPMLLAVFVSVIWTRLKSEVKPMKLLPFQKCYQSSMIKSCASRVFKLPECYQMLAVQCELWSPYSGSQPSTSHIGHGTAQCKGNILRPAQTFLLTSVNGYPRVSMLMAVRTFPIQLQDGHGIFNVHNDFSRCCATLALSICGKMKHEVLDKDVMCTSTELKNHTSCHFPCFWLECKNSNRSMQSKRT